MSLKGKRGFVVGVANERSIAAGCARAFRDQGADLILTCLNEKARPYATPIAESVNAVDLLELDVSREEDIVAAEERIQSVWGGIDFLVHAVAFCPKEDLHASVVDCSEEGFATAMKVSCYSLIRLSRMAAPLMRDGGSILTFSYYGGERVVDHYNIMGPVKAALESSVRYLAADLGGKGIRVNAISPGPIKTRAASGIAHFDELLDAAAAEAPGNRLATIEEVGDLAAFLAGDGARAITGGVHYVDYGVNTIA